MFTPGPSEIPTTGMSAINAYVDFVIEDTSRVGRGLGLPRIAESDAASDCLALRVRKMGP